MSTANPSPGGIREIDWLAPETRNLLIRAEENAQQRGAKAIYPEHLFLSLLAQHAQAVSSLLQQSRLDMHVLRARTEASFPALAPSETPKHLKLAEESLECIKRAIALVTYHLTHNKAQAMVQPEHLLLSIFYHPRMQKLFSNFSTNIFEMKNSFTEQVGSGFAWHMEQVFLSTELNYGNQQNIVHFANFNKARNKHILRSIEYPDLSFKHILGLSRAKQASYASIAFLRQPKRYAETSHGLLLFSQHPNDDLLFIRAMAGEAGVPLSSVYCTVLVEMFLAKQSGGQPTQAEQRERAYQLVREVFYPIKMFSHCLIYFQDLEALAVPELGQQHYIGWQILQKQFLTEFDKLKQQRGTVVIASTTHPQRLHSDFFRPGRLDEQIDLYKPVQLLREEVKHLLLPQEHAVCPRCKMQVQSTWKHCVYCRTALPKHCRNCNTPYPEIVGARFCPECGEDLR